MPKRGFGYFGFNPAPEPIPIIHSSKVSGIKAAAPGTSQVSGKSGATKPASGPGMNITARQVKDMPMGAMLEGKQPMTASAMAQGMASGLPPGISPGMHSGAQPGMTPGTIAKPMQGNVTEAARKRMAERKMTAGSKMAGYVPDFSPSTLLNGIILSEILGKPKCLQKTFGRRW
ncbi:MAG: hypothetical protein ACM3XR_10180 [Bacillota bacterium]